MRPLQLQRDAGGVLIHQQPGKAGTLETTKFGPICPQTAGASFNVRQVTQSEDCLYLNVRTRKCNASAKQPVMVWIHGGGFIGGGGSEEACDGIRLAIHGSTVVTFNYQLGAFGFLAHPEIGANFGIQDQIAALRWVQANIASFGGDPENVTIFGESTGAHSVRALLSCPSAHGLFHRAVMKSGGFAKPAELPSSWAYDNTLKATEAFFERLGTRDLRSLRKIPTNAIKEACHALCGILPPPGRIHTPAHLVWSPVVDNDIVREGFPGWSSDGPLMMGCVENEARYFLKPTASYPNALLENIARTLYGDRASWAIEYLESLNLSLYALYDRLDKLFTVAVFREPSLESARRFTSLGHSVYYYHFERCSPGGMVTN